MFTEPSVQQIIRTEIFAHTDWLDLDRGTLARDLAITRAVARTGLTLDQVSALIRSVPESLVAIPAMVELLYRLKANGHTLFCLSNMHVASIAHLEATYTFWSVFTGSVISCRVQAIKPEPEIYHYLLRQYALVPLETLFIDDMPDNLAAAALLGMRTLQFRDPRQCAQSLQDMGYL
jgi:putative hydrolase of the HAD superfamily